MNNGIIERLEEFADNAVEFIGDHSWWFFGIGSTVVFFVFVIPGTMSFGFNLLFILGMLVAAPMIGWPMMLIYMLPFGLIRLFCYCVRNPIESFFILLKIILFCVVLFLLAMCIYVL